MASDSEWLKNRRKRFSKFFHDLQSEKREMARKDMSIPEIDDATRIIATILVNLGGKIDKETQNAHD